MFMGILRKKLIFKVIITDYLDMDTIKKYVDNPNVEAVKAGNNLLITSDYKDSFNDILNSNNSKEHDESVINMLVLKVNKNVLIPRFETEQLIELTIECISSYFNKEIDIVDLKTDSGCIAITLKKMIDCNMNAVDISSLSFDSTKDNIKILK